MKQSIWFVVASMAAGFLSGILSPQVYGVHGAILGGMLAGGVLTCNSYRKKKASLPFTVILGYTAAVSLAAFLLIFGWDALFLYLANTTDIVSTADVPLTAWHSALACFLITLGVLLYCKNHSLTCFFLIPLLSVLPRAIAFEQEMGSSEVPIGVLGFSLFCTVCGWLPFMLLWGGVARLFGVFRKTPDANLVQQADCVDGAGKALYND